MIAATLAASVLADRPLPPVAGAGSEGRKTVVELPQSRQNSLPSGSAITMKPALIGGAGS